MLVDIKVLCCLVHRGFPSLSHALDTTFEVDRENGNSMVNLERSFPSIRMHAFTELQISFFCGRLCWLSHCRKVGALAAISSSWGWVLPKGGCYLPKGLLSARLLAEEAHFQHQLVCIMCSISFYLRNPLATSSIEVFFASFMEQDDGGNKTTNI